MYQPSRALQVIAAVSLAWSATVHAHPDSAPPVAEFLRVARGSITLDGRLGEPAWSSTHALDHFFEIFPGNRSPPHTRTTARFLYDDQALYVGVRMEEPAPASLRAQYVERDKISGAQDYVYVYIDALGSGHGAQYFVTDVRGVEADGHYSEASGTEDNAPDYRWQVATSHDADGWTAEFRIPFSTLRYVAEGSRWKLLVYRARPRTDYVQDASAPIARGANCLVCFFNPVQGLTPPPPHSSLLVTPEAVLHTNPHGGGIKTDFGTTAHWQFGGGRTFDITLNPDFSEVEADAIQVTGNARYAQSLTEKRPFFMDSLDLLAAQPDLDRPLQPVYTRDIADPDLGVRYTQRATSHDFTALVARDAGGGTLLLPGPYYTGAVQRNRESNDFIARYVQNLHGFALGGVMTDREYLGGGFNRVIGMDANWHPTPSDNINAEALTSFTRDVRNEPAATPDADSNRNALAGYAKWTHLGGSWTWNALAEQVGDGFRADLGFVPAADFRELKAVVGRRWFDVGAFSEIRPTLGVEDVRALRGGGTIVRSIFPGVFLTGPRGTSATIELHLAEHARADAGFPLEDLRYVHIEASSSPASWWPRLGLSGDIGQQLDLASGLVRPGGSLALDTAWRPADRLEFELRLTRAWLRTDAQDHASSSLLLDHQGAQLIAWLHLSVANQLRLQAFRERDTSISEPPSRAWATSLLFLHRSSWRSAWYVGISRSENPQLPAQHGWELLAKWTHTYGG